MPDMVTPGSVQDDSCVTEAVCIHTRKIYDSCRAKDCVEDIRVYVTEASLPTLTTAASVRALSAQLLWVSADVQELSFNRGYYTVDLTFYYRVTAEACVQVGEEGSIEGLAIFTKRVILFGSEGSVKVFTSDSVDTDVTTAAQPIAVVEAVDPIILRARLAPALGGADTVPCGIPEAVTDAFDTALQFDNTVQRLLVTLGQFSIVRLERDTQLSIPSYDYCVPQEECATTEEEDPCTLFSRINFPTDEFFPPNYIADPRFRDSCTSN